MSRCLNIFNKLSSVIKIILLILNIVVIIYSYTGNDLRVFAYILLPFYMLMIIIIFIMIVEVVLYFKKMIPIYSILISIGLILLCIIADLISITIFTPTKLIDQNLSQNRILRSWALKTVRWDAKFPLKINDIILVSWRLVLEIHLEFIKSYRNIKGFVLIAEDM